MRRTLLWTLLALGLLATLLPVGAAALALAVGGGLAASWPAALAAALAAAGASSGMAVLAARRILDPLRRLSDASLELARGKLGMQVKVEGHGEVGRLAEVFNYMSQQMLASDAELRGLYKSLEDGYLQTMLALASVLDSKDSYTAGHSQRVGEWAAEIGKEMGLPDMDVKHLLFGGILHDIGKIGVVEPILNKRSQLTPDEMDAMRAHPVIGFQIVGGVSFLKPILAAVRSHHERWDGTGYPDGLAGERIPLIARIVGAADTWDACTSIRTYQKPMTTEHALEVMKRLSGKQLDPAVVDAIERVVRKRRARGELVSPGDAPAA